jgi:hypothetical protein
MSESILPFSEWQRVQEHYKLPIFFRRVLWKSGNRELLAFLSLSGDRASLVIRLDEDGAHFLVVLSKNAEGISSMPRAEVWAQWVIGDFFATSSPRRRAPRSKPLERDAA